VADSRYQDHQFLGIFEQFQRTFALIRLRGNCVLFEEPKQKPKGSRGRSRKHGRSFKLNVCIGQPIEKKPFNSVSRPYECKPGTNYISRN